MRVYGQSRIFGGIKSRTCFLILSLHQLRGMLIQNYSLEPPVVIYDCVVMWQGRTYPVVLFNDCPTTSPCRSGMVNFLTSPSCSTSISSDNHEEENEHSRLVRIQVFFVEGWSDTDDERFAMTNDSRDVRRHPVSELDHTPNYCARVDCNLCLDCGNHAE